MTQQPSLFRKKPVAVSAAQWHVNGDHPLDYSKTHDGLENGELRQFSPEERRANGWEGDIVRYYRNPDDSSTRACQHCGKTMHVHGWIDTKEGGHIVCPGDWIITGVQGEHYPCKPDIFAATYEPAPTPPASAQDDTKVYHFEQRSRFGPWIEVEKPTERSVEFVQRSAAPAAGDARKPDFARAEQIAADFVQDYEWRGEDVAGRDTCYTPNKRERAMITDAILGLLAEPEFIAALAAQVPQQGEV